MDIVIPTLGRAYAQHTFNNMPLEIQKQTTLVVQYGDWLRHKEEYDRYPYVVLPDHIRTVGPTRDYILGMDGSDDVLILDDDLVFTTRRNDDRTKFTRGIMGAADWRYMLAEIKAKIGVYGVVGISHREGANRNTDDYVYNTRIMRATTYKRSRMKKEGIDFSRVPVMEDFDVLLQLMRRGYDTVALNNFVHNQSGSDTSGGCSTFRTPEVQAEAAYRLAELHPGFVTPVQKDKGEGWGSRVDVRVQWKKARASHGRS